MGTAIAATAIYAAAALISEPIDGPAGYLVAALVLAVGYTLLLALA